MAQIIELVDKGHQNMTPPKKHSKFPVTDAKEIKMQVT